MKNATVLHLQVDSALRAAAESVLHEGETLSGFVLEAVRLNIARGVVTREAARQGAHYVSSDEMLMRLDASPAKVRAKHAARDA